MAPTMGTNGELFVDPETYLVAGKDDSSVLYQPLRGLALVVNQPVANALRELRCNPGSGKLRGPVLAQLQNLGIVGPTPFQERIQRMEPQPEPAPLAVSLFLTSSCNLRCVYCYASGGDDHQLMDLELARAAVDLVVRNAVDADVQQFDVHFHGGGEPTMALDLMRQIVEYAQALGKRHGRRPYLTVGTNGVMAPDVAHWLAGALTHATVSIDGDAHLHDTQRPTAGAKGSHATVVRTLQIFDQQAFSYSLRVTATSLTTPHLPDIVDYLTTICGAERIKIEPVFVHGRAASGGLEPPDTGLFIDRFLQAARIARARERHLVYSAARLGVVSDRFCGVAGGSLSVTPSGDVTACYEVTDPKDERADLFFFGRYDAATKTFQIDQDRLSRLADLTVNRSKECSGCFAKWHCAGDCPAKTQTLENLDAARPLVRSWRCEINRELTRQQLLARIQENPDLLGQSPRSCP